MAPNWRAPVVGAAEWLRHFKLPGGTDFAIPVDWWDAAGMEEFSARQSHTIFFVSPSGEPNQVQVCGGASAYGHLLLGFRA
jgi:hypothetical protein